MQCPFSLAVVVVLATVPTTTTVAKVDGDVTGGDKTEGECCMSTPSSSHGDSVKVAISDGLTLLQVGINTKEIDDKDVYQWNIPDDAPAGTMLMGGSSHGKNVVLGGLKEEKEIVVQWRRTHKDTNRTTKGNIVVIVEKDAGYSEAVEIVMAKDLFEKWTVKDVNWLMSHLSSSLSSALASPDISSLQVHLHSLERLPFDGRWYAIVHVEEHASSSLSSSRIIPSIDALHLLQSRTALLRELKVERVEQLHCSLECSGHGHCDSWSKNCECDDWWMPSPWTRILNGGRKVDCSWSATRVSSLVVLFIGIFILLFVATKKHKSRRALLLSRRAARRRQRYEQLKHEEDERRGTSRTRQRSLGAPPTLVALPPRRWSCSSSLSSDDDLIRVPRPPHP